MKVTTTPVMSERLLLRITYRGPGCWIWSGQIDRQGYGRLGGKMAHRLTYQEVVGQIPANHHLDHLCRNRDCVNPSHLEPVTNAENVRRAAQARERCKRDHLLSEHGVIWSDGARHCRACHRERRAARLGKLVGA